MVPGRPVFHINVLPAALTFMMIGYGFKYLIDKDLHLYDKIKGNYAIACVMIFLELPVLLWEHIFLQIFL